MMLAGRYPVRIYTYGGGCRSRAEYSTDCAGRTSRSRLTEGATTPSTSGAWAYQVRIRKHLARLHLASRTSVHAGAGADMRRRLELRRLPQEGAGGQWQDPCASVASIVVWRTVPQILRDRPGSRVRGSCRYHHARGRMPSAGGGARARVRARARGGAAGRCRITPSRTD